MNLKCFASLFFFKINLEEAFASVLEYKILSRL